MINKIIFLAIMILLCSIEKAQFKDNDTLLFTSGIASSNTTAYSPHNSAELNKEKEPLLLNLLQRSNLSDDWWGIRNNLSESGLDFEFVYKGEMFSNIYGGIDRATTTLDNIDVILLANLGKSFGWENTNFLIHFLGNSGAAPNELVGASQGISNIEATPTWKLYQFLIEKKFFEEQFSIATGLYDLNSEFDVRETSCIFINPSHGIGAEIAKSGLNGPSIFPTTSVAVRLKFESESGNYIQTAILDGVPGDPKNPYGTHIIFDRNEGLLLIAELGIVKSENEQLNSKIAFGAWTYTSNFDKNNFEGGSKNIISLKKNYGFYLTAEKLLAANFENLNKNLSGFLRIGYANKITNPIDFYFGAGFKCRCLFSGRDEDELGVAFALSHNSSVFRNTTAMLEDMIIKSYEINLEATYSFHLTQWLKIQPDIQYIINPAYCSKSKTAFVMGSRIQLII
ncbi:MAG: carbohydrate porin [Ignavibacteriaceae bacterium]|jgi:porin|nr:carbohydrate porin [Ignavibacteriaceae bacterium]